MKFEDLIKQVFDDKLVFTHSFPHYEFDTKIGEFILDENKERIPILNEDGTHKHSTETFTFKHFNKKAWNKISLLSKVPIGSLTLDDALSNKVEKVFDSVFIKIVDTSGKEFDMLLADSIDKLQQLKYFASAFQVKVENLKKSNPN